MKILVDLNVLLDVVLNRVPYVRESAQSLGRIVSSRKMKGYLAQHAVTMLFYIVRKQAGLENARLAVRKVLKMFEVVPASKEILLEALSETSPDYEDAVSFLSASAAKCDMIITRNPKDFASSTLRVVTPAEFLDTVT